MKRIIPALTLAVFAAVRIAFAAAANDPTLISRLTVVAAKDERRINELEKAYLDVFTILRDDNTCSRLYGGPAAIEALDVLMQKLRPAYLDKHIAVRMSGETTMFRNGATGFSFRMFEKAEINMLGSFYRSNSPSDHGVPRVADFQPNTRKTRAALLLHELGHLVRGEDKQWVLSDDGHDIDLSVKNTQRVVEACREEIENVTRMTVAQQLEKPLSTVAQMATEP